ncbi:MAG: hypothetical protein J7621_28185 [Niastella sp.]|nr:hypothetical protein [Niastella sp.]
MKLIKPIFITAGVLLLGLQGLQAQAPCDTITGTICKSIIADTVFNPYVTGVLGNWRANKSYTYYARRTEQDPTTATTNIRRDGTFKDFTAFWAFQSNKLGSQIDTGRWVWNSELTLFNRKGFEVENRDPLGRYNAGLYGYNLTMPVAVVQNSRYRESAYEGFEDYVFTTQLCDTACAAKRHIDYSDWLSSIDTTQSHTGLRSLRVAGGEAVVLSFELQGTAQDDQMPKLNFVTKAIDCASGVLDNISTGKDILLPVFKPVPGKRMLISAWVKETGDATLRANYTENRIRVVFGNTAFTFHVSGNIIEGWQRYEGVFTIPDTATRIDISLEATGANTAYFDDLRVHPFNANMKSFAFHPVNLRLMAELDENNYATLYEYDDDGTLIRLKKETQRGVKTIKETRSALVK